MVPDHDTDAVFISGLLVERHPEIFCEVKEALGDRLYPIPGTKDIWCRDFMPIQLAPDRFVQFRFDPDYLEHYPELRTDDGAGLLGLSKRCVQSDLVIDGGNIVRWNDAAILTNKIYRENPGVERPRLREGLRRTLEIERLVVIPKEPGDIFGHSDGMVRFVDEKTVLVNDYCKIDPAFGKRLLKVLDGLEIIPFPYAPIARGLWGVDPAVGVYINFLQLKDIIICPIFDLTEDEDALDILSQCFPKQGIVPLRCNELAMGGGVLNCITWNIKMKGG